MVNEKAPSPKPRDESVELLSVSSTRTPTRNPVWSENVNNEHDPGERFVVVERFVSLAVVKDDNFSLGVVSRFAVDKETT